MAVVETVWREVCQVTEAAKAEEEQTSQTEAGEARLKQLITALLLELSRTRCDHTHLQAALTAKTEQYNQQVGS